MADKHSWDKRYAAKELVWSAGPNAMFAEQIKGLAAGKALDIASGEGRNAIYLAEQGWQVTAVDFSKVGIDKGQQIAAKRGVELTWIVGDVSTADLGERAYDLVAVLYLHTGMEERNLWLKNAANAVAPGGTFLYIGHDPSNIERGVGGPQDPALLPDAETIARSLHGFQIDVAEVVERPVSSDPGHGGTEGIALDTLVRARKT